MTNCRKNTYYFVGACGICVALGGFKLPFLFLTGLAISLSGVAAYGIDMFVCSPDFVLPAMLPIGEDVRLPETLGNAIRDSMEYKEQAIHPHAVNEHTPSPPITYNYDGITGQWGADLAIDLKEVKVQGFRIRG